MQNLIFGIYCEVNIDVLKQIQIKYIEDYEELVRYLLDFHMMPVKPSILAIDGVDRYFEQKCGLVQKQVRLQFLLTLIK